MIEAGGFVPDRGRLGCRQSRRQRRPRSTTPARSRRPPASGTSTILVNGTLTNTGTIEAEFGNARTFGHDRRSFGRHAHRRHMDCRRRLDAGVPVGHEHHHQPGKSHDRRPRREHHRHPEPCPRIAAAWPSRTERASRRPAISATPGSLTLGAGSTLSVTGTYTQASSASLTIGIGGTAASGQFGDLSVTGTATLAGAIGSTIVAGFNPTAGNSYTIASYASETGGSSISFDGLANGRFTFFKPTVGSTSIVLGTTTSAADLAPQSFTAPGTGHGGTIDLDHRPDRQLTAPLRPAQTGSIRSTSRRSRRCRRTPSCWAASSRRRACGQLVVHRDAERRDSAGCAGQLLRGRDR